MTPFLSVLSRACPLPTHRNPIRMSSFQVTIDRINSLQTNASLLDLLRTSHSRFQDESLPGMRSYLKRVGYEPSAFDRLNMIHITGTKGKGSTSAMVQSILHRYPMGDKPLRTGLFTSPHLISIRERIRINGEPLSEALFAKYSDEVWDSLEKNKQEPRDTSEPLSNEMEMRNAILDSKLHPDKPSYFRYLNILAFHVFMREEVDVAILEVGIGGEYDSTNIIERPIACGITALGIDHVNVMGNTIDKIAWHKAGILKPHVPAVSFEQLPEAIQVVEQRAREKNASLQIVHASDIGVLDGIEIGLAGIHQKYNALVAIALCKIWLKQCRQIELTEAVPKEFHEGLAKVNWPGRAQKVTASETKYASQIPSHQQVTWYLDGAHTVESLQVCIDWFREIAKDKKETKDTLRVLIFNCTNGRDGANLLNVITRLHTELGFDHVVFTTNITFREGYTSENTNNTASTTSAMLMQSVLAESWREAIPSFHPENVHMADSIEAANDWVVEHLKSVPEAKQLQVLTTGSLILVGNTLNVLGLEAK
ncbi:Mur ligase [Spinellus fusiger]|nr:Mur ligase [Spinellus fusiger]